MRQLVRTIVLGLCSLLALGLSDVGATDITISIPGSFRDNRGPNPVGTTPGDRDIVSGFSITPSGPGTTAVATQGAVTLNLPFLPFTAQPNNYSSSIPFDPALVGAWTITATTAAGPVTALTNPIPNPEVIPLVTNLQVIGTGVTPTVSWTLPDLTGLGVDRALIRVWDLDRTVFGSVKDIIFTSQNLPVAPIAFTFVNNGLLHVGGHYAFDVILDDFTSVNGGPVFLQNRSETFTQTAFSPVPEPSTLGLMIFSVGALTGLAVRRKSPK
jgi:hypothetical protein